MGNSADPRVKNTTNQIKRIRKALSVAYSGGQFSTTMQISNYYHDYFLILIMFTVSKHEDICVTDFSNLSVC